MENNTYNHINNSIDAANLAHHIVNTLHRPDYHPDDIYGDAAIDQLVDEAFNVCGDDLYRVFSEECWDYLKVARG